MNRCFSVKIIKPTESPPPTSSGEGVGNCSKPGPKEKEGKAAGRRAAGLLLQARLTYSSQDQVFISLGNSPSLNHKSNKDFQYVPLPCLISCSSCQSSAMSGSSLKSPLPALNTALTPKVTQTMKAALWAACVCRLI